MAFSFSNWFKKPSTAEGHDTATVTPEAPGAPPAPPAAASGFPSAPPAPRTVKTPTQGPVRALKTVVPNSVRPVNLREGLSRPGVNPIVAPSAASLRGPSAIPGASQTRPISFPGMVPVSPSAAPAPAAPSPTAERNAASAPPAFTSAPDAAVSVPLGEFFDRIPTNLLRAGAPVDREREVVFHAGDLYSDLARGKASVPVSAVQAACPDLFNRPVEPTEDVEVALPLQRVIEQLASTFHARPDQVPEEDVAEIETPFLQVALEDSVRLPKPPAPPAPVARPTVAATPPAPPRKTASITGNESLTIRALTPRQTPAAPHAPAHAPAAPSPAKPMTPPTRDSVAPINGATKRPPSTVRASVAGGKIRLSGPAISSRSIAPAAAHATPAALAPSAPPAAVKPIPLPPPSAAASAASAIPAQKKTARIQIPAIALRPASAPAPGPAAPARPHAAPGAPPRSLSFPEPLVSFRATPGEGSGAAPAPVPPPLAVPRPLAGPNAPPPMMAFAPVAFTPPPPAAPPVPAAPVVDEDDGARIIMALAPILRTLPEGLFANGLDGYAAAEQVPDDAKVELPLRFITTQLAQGRVAVPRAMFVEAMPAQCRHLMPVEGEPNEVLIPLQEVFQNLPTGALSRRHDQVVETIGPEIPTPFSQKAQEDAQRLAPPPADPEPEPLPEEPAAELIEPEPAPEVEPEVLEEEEPAAVAAPVAEEEVEGTDTITHEAEVEEVPTLEVAAPEPLIEAEAPAAHPAEAEPPPEETAPEAVEAKVEEPAPVEAERKEEEVVEPARLEEIPAPASEIEPEPEPEPEPVALEPEPVVTHVTGEPAPEASAVTDAAPEVMAEPVPVEEVAASAPVEEIAPPEIVEAVEAPEPVVAESLPEREFTPFLGETTGELPVPALPAVSTNGQHAPAPTRAAAASREEIMESLRAIFMVDEDLDAKKVVRLISELPGLKACAVMFGDGLKLAGELENGLSSSEGFCAMTPPFFRRARTYATELGLGETQCVSIQTERALLSLFMAGDICLSVQHAGNRSFLPGVREKLLAASAELARMYATPVSASR